MLGLIIVAVELEFLLFYSNSSSRTGQSLPRDWSRTWDDFVSVSVVVVVVVVVLMLVGLTMMLVLMMVVMLVVVQVVMVVGLTMLVVFMQVQLITLEVSVNGAAGDGGVGGGVTM